MTLPLSMLAAHFVGDFVLQSNWMALNKSKRWDALFSHVYVYTFVMVVVYSMIAPTAWASLGFMWITLLTHLIQDYFTSRLTSKLWFFTPIDVHYNAGGQRYQCCIPVGGNRHWFFVVIGADQLLHFITLALTMRFLA